MPPRRTQRRRETKGLGSVFESPKGSGRWFFRPPPINKAQQPAIRAASEAAARTLQQQFRRDQEDGIQGGRAHTVRTWMPIYFQAASDQGTAKDSTIEGYEQKDRLYISAHLGDILLSELTTARVRQWFARDLVGTSGKLLSVASHTKIAIWASRFSRATLHSLKARSRPYEPSRFASTTIRSPAARQSLPRRITKSPTLHALTQPATSPTTSQESPAALVSSLRTAPTPSSNVFPPCVL